MLIFRNIYIISVLLFFLGICNCIILTIMKSQKMPKYFFNLEISTALALIFSFSFYFIKDHTLAYFFWCAYLIVLDIVLYYVFYFVITVTGEKTNAIGSKIMHHVYSLLVVIDAVLLVTGIDTERVFSITSTTIDESFTTWTVFFSKGVGFHLLLCYLLAATIGFYLIKNIITGFKYKRAIYISLLSIFIIIMFSNGMFVLVPELMIFDVSSIIYGYLLIYVFYYMMYSVPQYLKKNLILINSENLTDAIICFDEKNKFTYCNKIAKKFFSNTKHEQEWAANYLSNESDFFLRTERVELNGEDRSFKVEFRRMRDKQGRIWGSYLKLTECTAEVKSMEREAYRATHDELTGLYNRDFFFREMSRILKSEPDVPRYLVCTDINNFKLVNELFGAEFGDRLLIRQAEMLSRANYPGVIHGRISGDRYAMLIPKDKFNIELASKNTEKITELEKEVNFKLTVFIGIYEITDPTENVHVMYDKANLAIKNLAPELNQRIIFYDTALMNRLMMEKTIVSEFDYALNHNQFEMYLQPQIDTSSGLCVGAEALVRWNHPEKGCVAPGDFISALEKSDQIYKLDYYVWEQAAKKLAEWNEKGIDKYISVNISVKDFYYCNIFEYFKALVEKYGISPSRLNLEITESIVLNKSIYLKDLLKQLRDYGFKVEMDDFGSGYSSLAVLKNTEMDVLKIDMGFLRKTENDDKANLIISSVVKMAKKLGMEIVSEGVETKEQTDFLTEIGVDLIQGYLYSKPVPVFEFEKKYLEEEK